MLLSPHSQHKFSARLEHKKGDRQKQSTRTNIEQYMLLTPHSQLGWNVTYNERDL